MQLVSQRSSRDAGALRERAASCGRAEAILWRARTNRAPRAAFELLEAADLQAVGCAVAASTICPMRTELAARRWLAADALYCAGAGLMVLALARPLASLYGVPYGLALGLGGATVVWAAALAILRRANRWRSVLVVVAAANSGAAVALAMSAVLAIGFLGRGLLLAVALEVAAFAVMQVRLLRSRAAGAR